MKRIILGAFSGGVLLAIAGCGSGSATERTMTVQGALASTTRHTDNARAVAISDTGRKYWAYLSAKGGFTLKVPVGHAYRVVFANQLPAGGQVKIGHVTVASAAGPTAWVGANRGGATVNLGNLKLSAPTTAASGVTTLSYGAGGGGGGGGDEGDDDHSGDYGCHHEAADSGSGSSGYGGNQSSNSGYGGGSQKDDNENDNDSDYDNNYDHDKEKCDVYEAKGEDVDLKPSKEPGSGYSDSKVSQHQQQEASGAYGDQKPCTSACGGYGGYGGGSQPASQPSSSTSTSNSASSSSSGGYSAPSAPSGGGSTTGYGSAPAGSGCNTTASCTTTCSCVASKCQPAY